MLRLFRWSRVVTGMSALTQTSLPVPPITRTCLQRPCSRPAPSAQPVEAPAPRPRSGIAGLLARGPWPDNVTTGSSLGSVVHTAPGYLCPCRHSQAVKQLWFGRTLTHFLVMDGWKMILVTGAVPDGRAAAWATGRAHGPARGPGDGTPVDDAAHHAGWGAALQPLGTSRPSRPSPLWWMSSQSMGCSATVLTTSWLLCARITSDPLYKEQPLMCWRRGWCHLQASPSWLLQ